MSQLNIFLIPPPLLPLLLQFHIKMLDIAYDCKSLSNKIYDIFQLLENLHRILFLQPNKVKQSKLMIAKFIRKYLITVEAVSALGQKIVEELKANDKEGWYHMIVMIVFTL